MSMFSTHRLALIFPQLSYILITSYIQEFWDYVQSKLLYGLSLTRAVSHHILQTAHLW